MALGFSVETSCLKEVEVRKRYPALLPHQRWGFGWFCNFKKLDGGKPGIE